METRTTRLYIGYISTLWTCLTQVFPSLIFFSSLTLPTYFFTPTPALSLRKTPIPIMTVSSRLAFACLTAGLCSSASTGCSTDDVFTRCFSKSCLLWQSTMDLFLPGLCSSSLVKVREIVSAPCLLSLAATVVKFCQHPQQGNQRSFLLLMQNQEKALGQDGEVEWTERWDNRYTFPDGLLRVGKSQERQDC